MNRSSGTVVATTPQPPQPRTSRMLLDSRDEGATARSQARASVRSTAVLLGAMTKRHALLVVSVLGLALLCGCPRAPETILTDQHQPPGTYRFAAVGVDSPLSA